ncbi:glycosyltransferase family 4 protein [Clostridium sp. DJ247]|uniref:glycosyltransferase family 4 protein n=1 Tax=Clostridium sp. DJ247 TaxID=2726188 RepID=UPI0016254B31|nr:glycosyltransferase [Clostridium sp. DJ247]MBC2581571.1 glycosyltransferase [Clostridium sp. DJ247]
MKKILVLNFFPAFVPPASGGELRYFNIYSNLSKYFDVTLLSPTYPNHKFEIVTHSDTFREYRVPKESIHDTLHMNLDKENICSEVSALVCALSSEYPNMYHYYYNKLYSKVDIIIHEFPYMLKYDTFFGLDNKPRIYNSHNLESDLVRQMWKGEKADNYIEYITQLEKRLVREASLVFATCNEERDKFIKYFSIHSDKIKLAPNGITPSDLENNTVSSSQSKTNVFFIGSGHPPNIEAVEYIINDLADKCPNVEFIVAGSCCDKFSTIEKENVRLVGRIDDEEKRKLFSNCDLAINPMFSGAGTNLKTLEFLSAGIPMISTEVGVRGLDLVDGEHFILANRDNFASKLLLLESNKGQSQNMALKGKEYVNANYSWENIAINIKDNINKINPDINSRKSILVLNDFEISNPLSGGQIRVNKLYSEVSKFYNIILVCLNERDKINITRVTDNFWEISIPKTGEHLKEQKLKNDMYWISVSDIVTSYMCTENNILMESIKNLYEIVDVVIATHPYMVMTLKGLEGKPLIYESHNCETELKKQILKGHPQYENMVQKAYLAERTCYDRCDFVVSVSDEDHKGLKELNKELNKEIVTIKNGVQIPVDKKYVYKSVKNLFGDHPLIFFIGSAHYPNIQSLKYIVEELAPKTPEWYYAIVGSVCEALDCNIPKNVLMFGRLSDNYKNFLLKITDVAINPIISGSGSNLKLAEYFASKVPVVSTELGVRGYNVANESEVIVCKLNEFREKIEKIIIKNELKNKLVSNAYNYVNNELTWEVLGGSFQKLIKEKILDKKKLLVVTYRFTDPPLGGAEVYMLNILKELQSIGDFKIDVLSLDIKDLQNKFHFSSEYTFEDLDTKNYKIHNMNVFKFNTDVLSESEQYNNSKELYKCWMEESLEMSTKNINKYISPILMGGWYYPEKSRDEYEMWSSGKSLIYVNGASKITIKGYSPSSKYLILRLDGREIFNDKVSNQFKVEVKLDGGKILELETEVFSVKNKDPRLLGIKVHEVLYETEERIEKLSLGKDYKSFMKENYLDDYIDLLICNAMNRQGYINELFQKTRGPVSQELENWLERNIVNYDVVIGHNVPFSSSVIAEKYAKKYDVPAVILPHFHIDDEFYYWKDYLEALGKADNNIAFPRAAISLFYDKLKAKSTYIPGGGIYKEEYLHINTSEFLKKYNSDLPFILVLGRKAGSKNYRSVIEAVKEINKHKKVCNIVLIGRDEDEELIDKKDAIYLGEQSREVVLGALNECFCLVTMSDSESFGIVVLEAWMQKKPVVVNEMCTASTELVENMVNGLYANKINLKDKIEYLLKNIKEAEAMGQKGFETVGDKYTWKAVGEEVNKLLKSAIDKD